MTDISTEAVKAFVDVLDYFDKRNVPWKLVDQSKSKHMLTALAAERDTIRDIAYQKGYDAGRDEISDELQAVKVAIARIVSASEEVARISERDHIAWHELRYQITAWNELRILLDQGQKAPRAIDKLIDGLKFGVKHSTYEEKDVTQYWLEEAIKYRDEEDAGK